MEGILISTMLVFIKLLSPLCAILAFVLFLNPKLFTEMEKKLSTGLGTSKLSRKSLEALEKENMSLQQLLIQYNRFAGFLIFVFSVIIIVRLYLHVSL